MGGKNFTVLACVAVLPAATISISLDRVPEKLTFRCPST
jgi:hypothetical protein